MLPNDCKQRVTVSDTPKLMKRRYLSADHYCNLCFNRYQKTFFFQFSHVVLVCRQVGTYLLVL